MNIFVVPHDPDWAAQYEAESNAVRQALGDEFLRSHHIGSTSIPTIWAKPIIDQLVVVTRVEDVDQHSSAMEELGYECMGEFGIPTRRYFRKNDERGERAFHIHAFADGSPQIERHLNFRDYMLAHPDVAEQYSDLKRRLAEDHPKDIYAYMDGKDPFIKEIDKKAAAWQNGRP